MKIGQIFNGEFGSPRISSSSGNISSPDSCPDCGCKLYGWDFSSGLANLHFDYSCGLVIKFLRSLGTGAEYEVIRECSTITPVENLTIFEIQ